MHDIETLLRAAPIWGVGLGFAAALAAAAWLGLRAGQRGRQPMAAIERDGMYRALQRSEATWRAMFEGLTDAAVFADPQRHILHVNPAFCALWGYTADEVRGRSTELLYADPADFAALGQRRFSTVESPDRHTYHLRYRRRDGSEFWGESIGIRVADAGGEVFGYLGVHRDITQRRQAEEALRQSRAQLAAFVQQAPHAMAMFDRGMNYLAASRLWTEAYGGGRADLTGLYHYEVLPNVPDHWRDAHRRALAGATVRNDSDHWVQDDGTEHWGRWMTQPWTDEQGGVAGIIISAEDITEQVLAERSDRETRERLAVLFEAAPVAMVIADLSDGRYIEVNTAYAQLLGYAREDMLGRTSTEMQIWADPEGLARGLATLRAGGELRQQPSRFRRRDGEVLDVLLTVVPLKLSGRPHYFGAAVDVTQQQCALRDLNEAHERFSRVFESAPIAMALSEARDNTFVEVNAPFEALVGRPRAEILGRHSLDLGFWAETTLSSDVLRRLETGVPVQHQEATFRRADGTLLDVDYSGCVVEIAGRRHIVSMVSDVTAQVQARRALLRHQQELESLVAQRTAELESAHATLAERAAVYADLYNGAPCGYHALTPEGLVAEVNDTELAMLGYTREEFVGQPIERFGTPASREAFHRNFPQLKRAGTLRDLEYELIRKDGSVLPVLISAVLVTDDAGRVYSRATVVDNSERKARERDARPCRPSWRAGLNWRSRPRARRALSWPT
ncbi:MAG: PAS domain S-box protein [Burkholderiaceae bacterium]